MPIRADTFSWPSSSIRRRMGSTRRNKSNHFTIGKITHSNTFFIFYEEKI